jgi:hypothetical protein
MAKPTKDYQQAYRDRMKERQNRKLNTFISADAGDFMDALAWYWNCSKKKAVEIALKQAWERSGKPVPPTPPDGETDNNN